MKLFLYKFGGWAYGVNISGRSALAVALAKSGGRADILHNLHYNYGFGGVVALAAVL